MKITMNNIIKKSGGAVLLIALMASCTKDPDSAGYEYAPDMYRSAAIEAYVDYGIVAEIEVDSLKTKQSARIPAEGTIPFSTNPDEAIFNMPYAYENSTAGYEAAGGELVNPLQANEENLAEGARLFSFMCAQCHGEKGKGDGKVVTVGQHAAPGAYDGPLKDLPQGKIFHVITYGKGMMGSHASQLNKKQRWQVAMHVKALQNGGEYPTTPDSLKVTLTIDTIPVVAEANLTQGLHQ